MRGHPVRSMVWNLPNTLTWLRIFAIPLVVVFFYLPYRWADPAAGLLFAVAGITDSLDGYFARKWHQTSRLGAFLDPVADKLIVAVALVLLVSKDMPPIIVPGLEGMDGGHATLRAESVRAILVLCSIVIIGREIAISALREWMAEIGQRGKVKVSQLAKYKTILQIVGLSCMLFRWSLPILPGFALPVFEIGLMLTVVAAVLTVMSYSMIDTIVVFDRVREIRGKYGHVSRQVLNDAINQTLSRTLLTAGTTTIMVAIMYFFGGSGIHGFTFVLFVGILVGTYSSVAIAAPILLLGHEGAAETAAGGRQRTVGCQLQRAGA